MKEISTKYIFRTKMVKKLVLKNIFMKGISTKNIFRTKIITKNYFLGQKLVQKINYFYERN